MRSHLSPESLLDIVETGRADAHLEVCERCRAQVEQAREALDSLRDRPIPEPSPLFWEHFAARVRESVDAETSQSVSAAENRIGDDIVLRWRAARAKLRPASLVAAWLVAVALIVIVAVTSQPPGVRSAVTPQRASGDLRATAASAPPEPADDAMQPSETAWALVTDAGESLDLEGATSAGFDIEPGAAERAAGQMTPDEQRELIRLLQAEVGQ